MKKIALFVALFAGMFTSAMAQDVEETTAKDSVFVVKNGEVVGAYEMADGDYVTFARPAEWHNVITDAPSYFYYNSAYTYDFTYKTTIQQLGTQNYFYVDNFLNSGGGFTFKIKNSDGTYPDEITDINTVDGIFEPVNGEGVSVDDYGSWSGCSYYVNNDWTWEDTVNNVTWTSFYFYGGEGYATFKGTSKYIELLCYPTVNGTGAFSTLYIDWR